MLVEEDGTSTTKYVYGNELISAKTYEKSLEELKQEGEKNKKSGNQQANVTYYYHYDNLKSTTLLTDATGNVVETYDYGTYGEVTSGDTTLTRFLYNGGLGVSSDSNGLYYMRARYYNPAIRRFINQDVETGSMDNNASLNRYAYVQGNPVSLTDPFGLSPDMEYGNYEANALKRLFKVADKVADYLPVVGTARDIKRSYNAFKNGKIADGIKHGATAALSLAVPTAKLATKAMKTTLKLAKNALKAEKCISKTAEIATEGIKLAKDVGKASKLAGKAGSVSAKIAKSVKNGVSTVARTVKKNGAKVYKEGRKRKEASKTFYTVQNSADAKRLLNGGTPWPTEPNRANLGEGVYAWSSKSDALKYFKKISQETDDIQMLEFEVFQVDLNKMKQLDMTKMADDEATIFLKRYAKTYDGIPDHGYDYIRRGTQYGVENYFNKSVFDKLKFKH